MREVEILQAVADGNVHWDERFLGGGRPASVCIGHHSYRLTRRELRQLVTYAALGAGTTMPTAREGQSRDYKVATYQLNEAGRQRLTHIEVVDTLAGA